jgi:hypothetical protein
LAGGPHRISVPLAALYAFGWRSELAAFVDRKASAEVVCEAFELHGMLEQLVDSSAPGTGKAERHVSIQNDSGLAQGLADPLCGRLEVRKTAYPAGRQRS